MERIEDRIESDSLPDNTKGLLDLPRDAAFVVRFRYHLIIAMVCLSVDD